MQQRQKYWSQAQVSALRVCPIASGLPQLTWLQGLT